MVATKRPVKYIEPQKGYQMNVLASSADIVISGAAAGVGKTWALLVEPIRYMNVAGFGGVIFRRTGPQIRNEGGLWDTSVTIYPAAKGKPKESYLEWNFPKGNKIKFSHLEHEKNIYDWQGSQIPFIGFDELTHFSQKMFWYLLSRNRSVCGVAPYVRATCNPDPDSWVADLVAWWINQDTGYAIPERDGVIRYFTKISDTIVWGATEDEVIEAAWHELKPMVEAGKGSGIIARDFVKSLTFITGSIYDNKKLLEADPGYLANLNAQDEQTKAQLLHSNWKVQANKNELYDYPAFRGMFDNVFSLANGKKYITADIAGSGSNKFVVWVWDGFEIIDALIMAVSNGPEVIGGIKEMAVKHKVPSRNICYDNDGIGGLVDGFFSGSLGFHGGVTALPDPDKPGKDPKSNKPIPENYKNLKTQCFYRSAKRANANGYKVSDHVSNMMYDDKSTIRQQFMKERKAIKRDKVDMDGKLCIIPKEQMKTLLSGASPDILDAFSQREMFELKPTPQWVMV